MLSGILLSLVPAHATRESDARHARKRKRTHPGKLLLRKSLRTGEVGVVRSYNGTEHRLDPEDEAYSYVFNYEDYGNHTFYGVRLDGDVDAQTQEDDFMCDIDEDFAVRFREVTQAERDAKARLDAAKAKADADRARHLHRLAVAAAQQAAIHKQQQKERRRREREQRKIPPTFCNGRSFGIVKLKKSTSNAPRGRYYVIEIISATSVRIHVGPGGTREEMTLGIKQKWSWRNRDIRVHDAHGVARFERTSSGETSSSSDAELEDELPERPRKKPRMEEPLPAHLRLPDPVAGGADGAPVAPEHIPAPPAPVAPPAADRR